MIGAWSNALTGSLGLMMAASGPDITEAALQRDDTDWWRLCREADQRAQKSETSRRREVGAPQPTIDALMYSLRERGIKALKESDTKRRLAQLSDQQTVEVGARLQRLKPHIAAAWSVEEVKTLFRLRGNLKNGGHR
jgi:hypothetical protein